MIKRLEALADAIARYCGWHDPASDAYRTRNPGLLIAISPKHARNERGYRIFHSFIDGYQALLFDLAVKCTGKSNSGLVADSTLVDLMRVYKHPPSMAQYVAKFLRRALEDPDISANTPLKYFVEDVNGNHSTS